MSKGKVVAVSGYFNPLHVGHLEMIEKAKALGDYLVVIINNDEQVKLKGSVPFMKEKDRIKIVESIKGVDEVFLSIDQDPSICKSLRKIKPNIFANGGDRHQGEIPETPVCKELNIEMVDGLGGKIRSSSKIIREAKKHKDKRDLEN
jgi:cytidyltransferase-like protein